jgi:uncharacterized membrane protein YfcA
MHESPVTYLLLMASALAAGVVNALAGGGTLLTFPTLLGVVSPVMANGTSTVALVPGSLASAWGYRNELGKVGRWPYLLVVPSLVGGFVGTVLVTDLPEEYFRRLIPWLILTATLLFLVQPLMIRLARRDSGEPPSDHPRTVAALAGLVVAQSAIAVYGGYFGAGIGILMLSALGLMGVTDIHEMNAVKTLLAFCINLTSAALFIIKGKVDWPFALAMMLAAIVGGYVGASVGRRLNKNLVRWIVIAIGFGLAANYFWRSA